MSINEIIKKHLPITNQKFSRVNTKITHCQNTYYGYCQECKEHKTKLCNEKLIFQNIKQVSNVRWHLYFSCSQKHKVIRWVIIDHNSVVIGNTKN